MLVQEIRQASVVALPIEGGGVFGEQRLEGDIAEHAIGHDEQVAAIEVQGQGLDQGLIEAEGMRGVALVVLLDDARTELLDALGEVLGDPYRGDVEGVRGDEQEKEGPLAEDVFEERLIGMERPLHILHRDSVGLILEVVVLGEVSLEAFEEGIIGAVVIEELMMPAGEASAIGLGFALFFGDASFIESQVDAQGALALEQ